MLSASLNKTFLSLHGMIIEADKNGVDKNVLSVLLNSPPLSLSLSLSLALSHSLSFTYCYLVLFSISHFSIICVHTFHFLFLLFQKQMEDNLNECYDAIAIFLSIHIVYRYRSLMQKRNVTGLDRYSVILSSRQVKAYNFCDISVINKIYLSSLTRTTHQKTLTNKTK